MQVTNRASFPIIASGGDTRLGYGEDITIFPNETATVPGPYIGEMGGGSCYVVMEGANVVCQEAPDDENGFQVTRGNPLILQAKESQFIAIRHYEDT